MLGKLRALFAAIVSSHRTRRRVMSMDARLTRMNKRLANTKKRVRDLERVVRDLREQNVGLRSAIVGLQSSERRHERVLLELRSSKTRDGT